MFSFSKPTTDQLAKAELEEAQRELLSWQTQVDYARAQASYYESKIRRLMAHLEHSKEAQQ